jgi:LuxR family transcriptional regulator, maltose regulon positive regulatory protein
MSALQEVPVWRGDTAGTPAKFAPPALSRQWARRDRLDWLLSLATTQHPLTLVTGPPGAGKSVLLSDWAHSYVDGTVAWLSVEEPDNEPEQFWRSVAAALCFGGASNEAAVEYWGQRAGDASGDRILYEATHGQPHVLVVDDFHLVTDDNVIQSVARLAHRLPPHFRLVIAGRREPAFHLQRLVRTGEAALIGANDLRFTLDECAALVALVARKLIPLSELETLAERSEGWAAGIHLAALALRDHDDFAEIVGRFSGAFGPVAEYMENEMLLRQPPDVVKFLLQTSVLGHLTPELCGAVSGRSDAEGILASLADQNLFVVPAGAGERGYRYHPLLADLLRKGRPDEDPSLRRNANLRAACWFERSGDSRSAAHHFTEAGAYERAFSTLFSDLALQLDDDISPDFVAGMWPEGPKTEAAEEPGRMYVEAATLIGAQRVTEAAQALQRLDSMASDGPDQQLWRGRAEFLWAVHADRLGDPVSVLDRCRAAEELMGITDRHGPSPDEPAEGAAFWTGITDTSIAAQLPFLATRAHVSLGQLEDAEALLLAQFGSEEEVEAGQPGTLATIACLRGRLRDAYRLAIAALRKAEAQGKAGHPATLDARLAMAEVLFEHNELETAQSQLEAALQIVRSEETTPWAWAVEVQLVRVMIARQHPRDALSRIGHLRQIGLRNPPPHKLLQKLNHVEVGCRLALGDLEGALLVARSIPAGEISCETMARIDLASGRPDRALTRLRSNRPGSLAADIRRLVLLTCAEMQHGRTLRADEALCRAVDQARPEGYVRPFMEEAAQIVPLLRVISANRPDPYLTQLIDHAERLVPKTAASGPGTMLEPLTAREREVLGYLPSHLSVPDIAARIYVSPNTVKSHLKSIYRKMGAASRGDAVTMAVSRGLL